MKRIVPLLFCFGLLTACSGDKVVDTRGDTLIDTITDQDPVDSVRLRFKRLVSEMPVPFDMLKEFSGAKLPFRGELLNKPEHAGSYIGVHDQAIALGIYGSDLAYMISHDQLGESAPYLRAIRKISDQVVVPSAFDESMMGRYSSNQDQQDSLQQLVRSSYERIDSTLQGNDRFVLATLVIAGGWVESIYLITQHIGDEQQNEKNKVLFDMLAVQQPYLNNITELLACFPDDSACKTLHGQFLSLKAVFPKGADVTPEAFSAQLKNLREKVAEMRSGLISIQ